MSATILKDLFQKYDIPAPRYTSYPTVPYWEQNLTTENWLAHLNKSFSEKSTTWSMYLHVPFCETLCTFCGCNTAITKNHRLERPYADLILQELDTYLAKVPALKDRPMLNIHLGGGTPTFLNADNLKYLLEGIYSCTARAQDGFEASIEVDPRRTTYDQLKVLRELDFTRVSLGVQDFNPEVQRLVNRIQDLEITRTTLLQSRELGYDSVNFDLIYGLAKQTVESMKKTVEQTIELRPDRIALYSFALVPWIKPAQRLFKDEDLPRGEDKRKLYEVSRTALLNAGYVEIGMDHFALPTDNLAKAMREKSLHRNFMGYTDKHTDVLLGLGVSAISETPESFHQNEKVLPKFEDVIRRGEISTFRGHELSSSDRTQRAQILELLTRFSVDFVNDEQMEDAKNFLREMIEDKLVEVSGQQLQITERGRPFLRNVAMVFDERLRRARPETQTFSQSI
jgi:oxygen-independent coproporphyrinogen-3 oxidase